MIKLEFDQKYTQQHSIIILYKLIVNNQKMHTYFNYYVHDLIFTSFLIIFFKDNRLYFNQ